jgi:hypothetical protein
MAFIDLNLESPLGPLYHWGARKHGYPITSEPLGVDYAAAKARCDEFLNPAFDSWRTGGSSDDLAKPRAVVGTFDWVGRSLPIEQQVWQATRPYPRKL